MHPSGHGWRQCLPPVAQMGKLRQEHGPAQGLCSPGVTRGVATASVGGQQRRQLPGRKGECVGVGGHQTPGDLALCPTRAATAWGVLGCPHGGVTQPLPRAGRSSCTPGCLWDLPELGGGGSWPSGSPHSGAGTRGAPWGYFVMVSQGHLPANTRACGSKPRPPAASQSCQSAAAGALGQEDALDGQPGEQPHHGGHRRGQPWAVVPGGVMVGLSHGWEMGFVPAVSRRGPWSGVGVVQSQG